MLVLFRRQIIDFTVNFQDIKSFLVIIWLLSFFNVNATSATSFLREGRALNQFKVFPIDGKKILLSKVYIGILTNIFTFINTNVLIALISSNLGEFILLEIVAVVYMVAMSSIQIAIDLDSIELKWVDIKDLFQMELVIRIVKPYFILTILPIIYIVLFDRVLHIRVTEYLNASFMIIMVVIYSLYSFKKIKANIK